MAVFVLVCLFCKLKWALKLETLHGERIFVWQTHKHIHTLHHTLALIGRTPGCLHCCGVPFLQHPKAPWGSNVTVKEKERNVGWGTVYEMEGWKKNRFKKKKISEGLRLPNLEYVPTTQSSENNSNNTFWITFQHAHTQTERSDGCRTELAMHYRNETNCKHSI